ncbi:MAG: hypothetical protein ACKVX7_05660 [Planctomycetota bacterium]
MSGKLSLLGAVLLLVVGLLCLTEGQPIPIPTQPPQTVAGPIGLQLDTGGVEIFSAAADGGRLGVLPIGMAYRFRDANNPTNDWEVWVIDSRHSYPLQEHLQIRRIQMNTQNTWAQAAGSLATLLLNSGVTSLSTHVIAFTNHDHPGTSVGTFALYTLQGTTKGDFVGCANIRDTAGRRQETWCLSPGVTFPIGINFVAIWTAGAGDPFQNITDPANLKTEMQTHVNRLLFSKCSVVEIVNR